MIRTLWIVASTIALANMLAIVGFLVWLGATDRLSLERVEGVRVMLHETLTEQAAREQEQERLEAEEAMRAEQAARARMPSLTAGEALSVSRELEERQRQVIERLRREVIDLQRALVLERDEIDRVWQSLRDERAAFEAARARIAAIEGEEQFERTVRLYESLRPAQAREMLQELIRLGEIEQVVAYLNAMQTRAASKILGEFDDDAPLAADLLERLRTRGLQARVP
ncbi:MAG: hypothetical protein EA379_04855 [Phycisphaerales bacterium]|nr:MAG: hypothetical protein EA379_04855 [Phycisphaerales bacterium]